jgi:hypothetical protein
MGGVGSGRLSEPLRKGLVEDHLDLEVLELHRERRLEPGEWCYWNWRRGDRALLTVMIQALDDGVELSYPAEDAGRQGPLGKADALRRPAGVDGVQLRGAEALVRVPWRGRRGGLRQAGGQALL